MSDDGLQPIIPTEIPYSSSVEPDLKPPKLAEEDPHADLEARLAVLEALVQHIADYLSDRNRPEELP